MTTFAIATMIALADAQQNPASALHTCAATVSGKTDSFDNIWFNSFACRC